MLEIYKIYKSKFKQHIYYFVAVLMETWDSRPVTAVNGAWTLEMVAAKTQVMGSRDDGVPLEKSY